MQSRMLIRVAAYLVLCGSMAIVLLHSEISALFWLTKNICHGSQSVVEKRTFDIQERVSLVDSIQDIHWPRHVIADRIGRLGNEMFIYASLVGIATMNNMTPVYTAIGHTLDATFENLSAIQNAHNFQSNNLSQINEYSNWIYDNRFERLHQLRTRDVHISTYLQSWKYFWHVAEKVRRAFTFKKQYSDAADHFLFESTTELRKSRKTVVFVGVHIRRTDWLNHMPNHDVGGQDYYTKAVKVMTDKLRCKARNSCIVYVVCSDDRDWAVANVAVIVEKATASVAASDCKPKVVHSIGRSASEDMAVLAACNHTIMNIGTYGWWGSWLAGGITIAFSKYPGYSPSLAFSEVDYYPPDWIVIA